MSDTLEQFETTDGQTVKKVKAKDGRVMRFADGTPINANQYAGLARHGVTSPTTPVETEDEPLEPGAWTREEREPAMFERVVEYSRPESNISATAYPWRSRAESMMELDEQEDDAASYNMGVWSHAIVDGVAREERVVSVTNDLPFPEGARDEFVQDVAEQVVQNASGYDDIVIVETFTQIKYL